MPYRSAKKIVLLSKEGGIMPIIVNVDVMLAKRKMSSGELAEIGRAHV